MKEGIHAFLQDFPEQDFPLLHHRMATLERYFKALLYAPLFGVRKLTQYDRQETGLVSILGKDYRSSTLNQFLSQLERVDMSSFLMKVLVEKEVGKSCYIDGHMIAFWSRRKMHKGKITMLGRIMSGSNAVISHDEKGRAFFVQYYSPDIHLTETIVDYCQEIVDRTGIDVFIIDREVNSLKIANQFKERKWGLLSMLDQNQYKELGDWDLVSEGLLGESPVFSGYWKDPKKRKKDGRWFVIVQLKDRLLPYWGTPKIKENYPALDCPALYSQRTEIQENRFKRMIDHGALNTNYGNKIIMSRDRHQERKIKTLREKQGKLNQRLEKKEEQLGEQKIKIEESLQKKHHTRLTQREAKEREFSREKEVIRVEFDKNQKKLNEIGEVSERGDRDFRKQRIMTFRTLLLENKLMEFLHEINQHLEIPVSIEMLLELFFYRNGSYAEYPDQCVYFLNNNGLSKNSQEILNCIIEGVNQMELVKNGKPVILKMRRPPSQKKKQAKKMDR